ncbi:hypothetical protein PPYR_01590 [Photinus pyralis]|uniref:DUF8040 domain-containing protein n=1 Tax=Photinus pyralis TaxID=7054 RepID=A0A5N4B5I7_PHOPY|nr:hypothetical protein PPYR_01590 [Photinus pyralis]
MELYLCFVIREKHIRPDGYFENWLPQYVETDFFRMFRMTRQTFHKLLNVIPHTRKIYHGGYAPVSKEKCLLITLWYLAKGETLRSIGDRFNLSDSTVFNVTNDYIQSIADLGDKYIVWPTENESVAVQQEFKNLCGYPGKWM